MTTTRSQQTLARVDAVLVTVVLLRFRFVWYSYKHLRNVKTQRRSAVVSFGEFRKTLKTIRCYFVFLNMFLLMLSLRSQSLNLQVRCYAVKKNKHQLAKLIELHINRLKKDLIFTSIVFYQRERERVHSFPTMLDLKLNIQSHSGS